MAMATVVVKAMMQATNESEDVPQWKKDLIARLRNQNKKNEERLLWIEHHPPHHHHALQTHHPNPKTDLVCPLSPENGFGKDRNSPESSDSEDLHYGPGIVNKLRNKYLSLALRESNSRPTILRKATSLENLLDEEEEEEDEGGKESGGLFRRRGGGNDGGSNLNRYRSANRRQDMKRARSVEAISRTNHDEEMGMTSSVTAKINNRQSLNEEILIANNMEKGIGITDTTRSYKKTVSIENGAEDTTNKYNGRINRPKRIPPLLNEREKPPVDVVKHAKLIFEKKPETRTKKPPQTGEVAAKVDSFNNIIVKTKTASKVSKPPIKSSKPVLNDKLKNNTQHHVRSIVHDVKPIDHIVGPVDHYVRPVEHHVRPAKPVILSEEITKPKSLDLKGSRTGKRDFSSLPSPIPDVSRVDIKHQDDPKNNAVSSLCETPDLILTSSPVPKIASPTYRKRSTQNFIEEERNSSFLSGHIDATNRYISPVHSPTKQYTKPTSLNFNKEELDVLGMKLISPISQKNITKNSATSVFNFINSHVDQNHLPAVNKHISEPTVPVSKPLKIEVTNGFRETGKPKMGLSAFEMEKNQKNAVKSGLDGEKMTGKDVKTSKIEDKSEITEVLGSLRPVRVSSSIDIGKGRVDVTNDDSEMIGIDVVGIQNNVNTERDRKKWQHFSPTTEKTSPIIENHSKSSITLMDRWENLHKNGPTHIETSNNVDEIKNAAKPDITLPKPDISEKEEPSGEGVENIVEVADNSDKSVKTPDKVVKFEDSVGKNPVKPLRDVDQIERVDRNLSKSYNKSASVKNNLDSRSSNSEESPVKVVFPKKTKPRVEEATSSVFNFTTRKDVPDYIANDTTRTPSRVVLPKPDEPGIKLLPEALLANFKEIQEVWEEDELIRSLEARPPSPCDITFINDNILIDGKSSLTQRAEKRNKLKISFVDDADIYEYPSETSLLLEESSLPSPLGGTAQVGHTVPTLAGSSLATYTPKSTELFQPGITKSFQEPIVTSKPDVTHVQEPSSDLVLEEVEQPVLFSSGSTSDILF